ncbi:MAG: hypothetical protein LUQ50_01140 [Methanospirillum sp.]|uniref:SPFH domain-containing protein n=1 Tax=Methanospirillum sp. TaxID=45200 RepID=UPI002373F6C0|nr:SPFH domain-containing protein [Methanospirillum sp.]MDD1727657.1 hypothetical protein [Methanospirillum sp.]
MSIIEIIEVFVGGGCILVLIILTFKITRQYERAVIFRFGKSNGLKGPGLFAIIPFVDRMVKVDLRVRQLDVPKQTVITHDNISVDVDAIIYYRVIDACRAIIEVEDYEAAAALIAQTTLRDLLGQIELDTILSDRDSLNKKIQSDLKVITEPWGIHIYIVTIRDVLLH